MFGLGIPTLFRCLFSKNQLTSMNLVRESSRNTYIPHSRGMFAHERCPRGNQYKPNVGKRIDTYGLKTRLQTRGGQQMLWRKILKGPTGWVNFVPAP
jgi:hypothetical protein